MIRMILLNDHFNIFLYVCDESLKIPKYLIAIRDNTFDDCYQCRLLNVIIMV